MSNFGKKRAVGKHEKPAEPKPQKQRIKAPERKAPEPKRIKPEPERDIWELEPPAKKPVRKKRRVWMSVLICVLALVILASAAGFIFINRKLSLINYDDGKRKGGTAVSADFDDDSLDIEHLEQKNELTMSDNKVMSSENVLNVVLLGTDDWGSEFSEDARADAIMLLSLNLDDGTAKLISIERGMGVPILDGEYKGQYDWITHCFRYGGADLVMREVQECFRVGVERYIRVNFNALVEIVDALGGVDIDLSYDEANYLVASRDGLEYADFPAQNFYWGNDRSKLPDIYPGTNHLTGVWALAYARLRAIDSDWVRITRQRTVMQACMDRIKNADIATLNRLCDQILPLISTNFTQKEISGLLLKAPSFLGVTFEQMTLPAEGTYGGMTGMGGRGMFAPDFDINSQILQDFLYGKQES